MVTEPQMGQEGAGCVPPACVSVRVRMLSCVQPFATPWTVARQAPLSMGFSRQEYWSGFPFSLSGMFLI